MNQQQSILYILLGLLFAFSLAYFLYLFKKKKKQKTPYILILLRTLSLFALALLLINPTKEFKTLYNEKPNLVVAVDNSMSIGFLKSEAKVQNLMTTIKNNVELQEKFNIDYFSFGDQTNLLDSLTFSAGQTDQVQVLERIKKLYHKTPVLLVTDGNQTKGSNYIYFKSDNTIYPVIVGDTTTYKDVAITQLNVNQYAFLDNKFPVEVFVNYKGDKSISTQLSIYKGKQKVFSKKIDLSKQHNSANISTLLTADKVGRHYYSARLSRLNKEQNTKNNRKDFSIEVVDQETKVLVLSSFYHPDLGAIKKSIESNKQRKVDIKIIDESVNLIDYQLIIIYQPTQAFASVYKEIESQNKNTVLITGTKTDWTFLNNAQQHFSKNTTSQSENYQAVYNSGFSEFVTKDIGFEGLPPLKDQFGKLTFSVPYQTLLFQKIGSTTISDPLLVTYQTANSKHVVLFGEGLWRWRMMSSIDNRNAQGFDDFWNGIVQFTATSKKANQLHLEYEKMLYSNQPQVIKALYVDQNYKTDSKVSISLSLTKQSDKTSEKIPFSLVDNGFQVVLNDLKPDAYSFRVEVEGKQVKSFGHFKVLDYNIEQQFSTANTENLKRLAIESGGEVGYVDNAEPLISNLLKSNAFKTIQKEKKQTKALIDWYWLLGLIILSLSMEWFIRKYRGMV